MTATPSVIAAAAAAVLSTKHAPDAEREKFKDQRFYVHSHVVEVDVGEPALATYLDDVYSPSTKAGIEVVSPTNPAFALLKRQDRVSEATQTIAESLRLAMESTTARPGIVFGFLIRLPKGGTAYGILKADLESEQRFYLNADASMTSWSIRSVRDILPPPQTKFSKYAIVPRPKLPGAAGVRDHQAESESAAAYFLRAIGVVMPRREGTKRAVAQAAKRSGYGEAEIRRELAKVTKDTPVAAVVAASFPDIPENEQASLLGTTERPMPQVIANDPYLTTWFTRNPQFQLTVDETVNVEVSGRTITVTLPEGHDTIDRRYEQARKT